MRMSRYLHDDACHTVGSNRASSRASLPRNRNRLKKFFRPSRATRRKLARDTHRNSLRYRREMRTSFWTKENAVQTKRPSSRLRASENRSCSVSRSRWIKSNSNAPQKKDSAPLVNEMTIFSFIYLYTSAFLSRDTCF